MMPLTLMELRNQLLDAATRALTTVDALTEAFGPHDPRTVAAIVVSDNLWEALAGVERAIAAGRVAA